MPSVTATKDVGNGITMSAGAGYNPETGEKKAGIGFGKKM